MIVKKYHYFAIDEAGNMKSGQIEGSSKIQIEEKLIQQGLIPNKITINYSLKLSLFSEKKIFEKILNSIADLLGSGLSITAALDFLIKNNKNIVAQKAQLIKTDLENGKKFSQSVRGNFLQIDPFYFLLLDSAEKTGDIFSCLKNISFMINKNNEFKENLLASLIYPFFLLLIIGAVVGFIMNFSLPQIISQFENTNNIPWPTKFIITLHNNQNQLLPFIGILTTSMLLLKFASKLEFIKRPLHWLEINTPIIKQLYFFFIQRKFLQILAFSLKGGVGLEDSLNLTSKVSKNLYYQSDIKNCSGEISSGFRFAQSIERLHFLSNEQKFIINIADESNGLPEAFLKLYQKNEMNNERKLKLFNKMLEPSIIILLGVVILIIALGIILPSLELSQGINLL